MKLSKKIYIRQELDHGQTLLLASASPEGEDGDEIGIYELVDIKKLKITESLV